MGLERAPTLFRCDALLVLSRVVELIQILPIATAVADGIDRRWTSLSALFLRQAGCRQATDNPGHGA
jgi:hypothetical protein